MTTKSHMLEPLAFPIETTLGFRILCAYAIFADTVYFSNSPLEHWVLLYAPITSLSHWEMAAICGNLLFFLLVVALSYRHFIHRIRKKLIEPGTHATEDEEAKIGKIARRANVLVDQILFTGPIRNRRALTCRIAGKNIIILGTGLRLLLGRNDEAALADIAHEIGHLKNRDVLLTQIARSLVVGTAIVQLLYMVMLLFQVAEITVPAISAPIMEGRTLFGALYEFARDRLLPVLLRPVPVLVSFVVYREFLRDRELYADRVAARLGFTAGLRKLFAAIPSQKPPSHFGKMLASHPSREKRRKAITDASHFFRFNYFRLFTLAVIQEMSILAIPGSSSTTSFVDGNLYFVLQLIMLLALSAFGYLALCNHLEKSLISAFSNKPRRFLSLTRDVLCSFAAIFLGMSLGDFFYALPLGEIDMDKFSNVELLRIGSLLLIGITPPLTAVATLALPTNSRSKGVITLFRSLGLIASVVAIANLAFFFSHSRFGIRFQKWYAEMLPPPETLSTYEQAMMVKSEILVQHSSAAPQGSPVMLDVTILLLAFFCIVLLRLVLKIRHRTAFRPVFSVPIWARETEKSV